MRREDRRQGQAGCLGGSEEGRDVNEKTRELLHRAVTDAIIALGTPVAAETSPYSWMDFEYAELRIHMAHCLPVYEKCTWDDSDWWEFAGTFDPDVRKQGIDLKLACGCGLLTGRTWRYTDGYAALIRAITGG